MIENQIPLIPSRYYLKLVELFLQQSEANHGLLRQIEHFLQNNELLSLHHIEQLIEISRHLPNSETAAFQLGKQLKLSSHSLVGYALLTSATFKDAISLIERYFRLIMPSFKFSSQIIAETRHIELLITPLLKMSPACLDFHLEAIAVAFYFNVSELLGNNLQPYHIYLSMPSPKHLQHYKQLKHAQIHFNTSWKKGIRIIMDQKQLDSPLPLADPYSLQVVEKRCQELARHLQNEGEIVSWLSMMLRQANQIPTLQECAQLLNLSPKTLQRYLHKQGVEFHILKQEITLERAIEMLEQSSKSITQIAYELGYQNPANFSRAFQKMKGCSPLQYRMQFQHLH